MPNNFVYSNIHIINLSGSTIEDDVMLSPSHNRIQCYTMRDNIIKTLITESRSNIDIISCSNSKENGELMMIVDIDEFHQVTRMQSNNRNALEESSGSISSMVIVKVNLRVGRHGT